MARRNDSARIHLVLIGLCCLVLSLLAVPDKGQEVGDEPLSSRQAYASGSDMRISSPAFEDEGIIPTEYTCDGRDVSPPLQFSNAPEATQSLALIMDDPDAPFGTFVHWVIWNIPPETTSIGEGERPAGVEGITGFGRPGYGGPCPPSGLHRYFFKLYALDTTFEMSQGSGKDQVVEVMQGHIVAEAVLMGRYGRGIPEPFLFLVVSTTLLMLALRQRH